MFGGLELWCPCFFAFASVPFAFTCSHVTPTPSVPTSHVTPQPLCFQQKMHGSKGLGVSAHSRSLHKGTNRSLSVLDPQKRRVQTRPKGAGTRGAMFGPACVRAGVSQVADRVYLGQTVSTGYRPRSLWSTGKWGGGGVRLKKLAFGVQCACSCILGAFGPTWGATRPGGGGWQREVLFLSFSVFLPLFLQGLGGYPPPPGTRTFARTHAHI